MDDRSSHVPTGERGEAAANRKVRFVVHQGGLKGARDSGRARILHTGGEGAKQRKVSITRVHMCYESYTHILE